MKFGDFKVKFRNLPLLPTRVVFGKVSGEDLNQLGRWCKQGLLLQLRRGLYILGKDDRKIEPSRLYLAGQLYQPSYVSLEYALSRYSLIPERVADVTSVSTKKTARFSNDFGTFSYQTVKSSAFRGFISVKDEAGLPYFIAEPEKAVADFIYLNLGKIPAGLVEKTLLESFRFQHLDSLNKNKVTAYFGLFNNTKMREIGAVLRGMGGKV
ncbi:MAG: hypothetical protein FD189_1360 [Elusimicrobia bacterium]|nr:MAG: hypothetical protein FD154_1134 [Elusimicrobiota bacterium]KAF0155560.1 MAG: hypothetical protein FD189_1360 [Elusimicrobiota bacterium]